MQVVEKSGEGLSRSYGVSIPATELSALLDARIEEILPSLQLKGFRPGKVPRAHVKRLYGKALMGEVVEKTINESSQQLLAEKNLRVAASPELKPVSDMEKVIAGGEDLAYDLDVEIMPDFEPADISGLTLKRPTYASTDEEVASSLRELAEQSRTYAAREGEDTAARDGDQVLIDFVGKIDGEAFEGGSAEGVEVVLGSNRFIPGFEEQLVGYKPGSEGVITVRFPDDYQAERLAGKEALFEVNVHEVRAPAESTVDDALAQRLGMGDLDALTNALRQNLDAEFVQASRFKLKRALLDALDERHDIPLPPKMVEAEFNGIWSQVEKDREGGAVSPEDEGKSEDDLKAEYRKIAERRVRLGLVLAEIGRRANVQVSEAELMNAMRQEATRYGEQAQQIFDFMRENPNMRAQMQAPLYEEKVVDHILSTLTIEDEPVSKEELLKDDDLPADFHAHHDHDHHHHDHDHDHAHGHDHDHAHEAPKPKKAKTPKAEAGETAEAVAEAPKPKRAKKAAEPAPEVETSDDAPKPKKPRAKKAAEGEA